MSGIPEIIGELFDQWQVKSYNTEKKFSWFWEADQAQEALTGKSDEKANIFIIWDGMPSRPPKDKSHINVLSHLTPIDWVLSISRHLLNQSKNDNGDLPPLRILVLDLHSHIMPGAFSCRMLDSILPVLPWVRWCRLLPWGTDKESPSNRYGPEKLKDALFDPNLIPALSEFRDDRQVQDRLDALVHAWIGHLSRSGDHHSINNLLGPMVLSAGFDEDIRNAILGVSKERKALLQRLKWLGLVQKENEEKKNTKWFDSETVANRLGIPINYVLIDDQANDGWVDVLAGALGLERIEENDRFVIASSAIDKEPSPPSPSKVANAKGGQSALWASESWKFLLNQLKERLKARQYDCRFKLSFLNGKSSTGEVLLLDLRLERDADKEIEYFQETLKLAEDLVKGFKDRNKKLPWGPIELKRLKAWRGLDVKQNAQGNGWRKDDEYIEFLTLLPRIISTMDLSLPIVIFSSSGQRGIVEALKNFRNVITGFEKPRFFGYRSEEMISEVREQVSDVLTKATKKLLPARQRCLSFIETKDPYKNAMSISIDPSKEYYLEFYIDETDPLQHIDDRPTYRKGWRVGGCFALFEGVSKEEAMRKADQFEDILVQNGVRYFEWKYNGVQPPNIIAKKDDVCHQKIQNTLNSSQKTNCKPIYFGVASLYQRVSAVYNVNVDLLDPHHDDQLFLTTLSALVEAFLYESVPALTGDKPPSVSIFAGTRINVINDSGTEGKSIEIARREQYRAGVGWQSYRRRAENGNEETGVSQDTFREDDFVPLVRNVIRSRDRKIKLHRVLGIQLPYYEKEEQPKLFACRDCQAEISTYNNAVHREKILQQINPGQIFKGIVTAAEEYGFFVEIYPGIQGLVPNSEVLWPTTIEIGRHYRGTVMRRMGRDALVDFGAPGWGKLYNVESLRDGDNVGVTLEQISRNNHMNKMFYDLKLLEELPELESATNIMLVGSEHIVKVVKKRSSDNKLRLSRTKAFGEYEKNITKLIEPPIICDLCFSSDSVYPDSRALHYVADQILTDMFGNGRRGYMSIFSHLIPGEFEEGWDEEFSEALEASRALDIAHSDVPRAVAVFPLHAKRVCVNPQGKETKPAIRDRVQWRIGRALESIDGEIFMGIVRNISNDTSLIS